MGSFFKDEKEWKSRKSKLVEGVLEREGGQSGSVYFYQAVIIADINYFMF